MEEPTKDNSANNIGAAADAAFSKIGRTEEPVKRGRGRPPGSKSKVNNDGNANAQNVASEAPPVIDTKTQELVESAVRGTLYAIDGLINRRIFKAAKMAYDSAEEAKEIAKEAALREEEIKTIAGSASVVAGKYALLATYLPETILISAIAGYAIRNGIVIKNLNELIEAKQALQANAT